MFENAGGAHPVAMVMQAWRSAGWGGVGGLRARSPAPESAREARTRAFFLDPAKLLWDLEGSGKRQAAPPRGRRDPPGSLNSGVDGVSFSAVSGLRCRGDAGRGGRLGRAWLGWVARGSGSASRAHPAPPLPAPPHRVWVAEGDENHPKPYLDT